MPYYHDVEARTVYDVGDMHVSSRNDHWHIYADVQLTRADNYRLDTGEWRYRIRMSPRQEYFQSNDTRQKAQEHFRNQYLLGFGTEITEEAYMSLQAAYEEEARSNQAP